MSAVNTAVRRIYPPPALLSVCRRGEEEEDEQAGALHHLLPIQQMHQRYLHNPNRDCFKEPKPVGASPGLVMCSAFNTEWIYIDWLTFIRDFSLLFWWVCDSGCTRSQFVWLQRKQIKRPFVWQKKLLSECWLQCNNHRCFGFFFLRPVTAF